MKRQHVKKGEIILRQGDLSNKKFYVLSGLLRSYHIDKSGKENIFLFAPEGWLIADTNAHDMPSELFIQALEDSVVISINKGIEKEPKNIEKLIKRLPKLQERIIMLLSTNALERYDHFIKTYPEITQRVSQRMIASYLGVTPETLSAAKSKWHSEQERSTNE